MWFETKKHRHKRLLHNARCRRYYQKHLSIKAKRKALERIEKKTKELPSETNKEPQIALL